MDSKAEYTKTNTNPNVSTELIGAPDATEVGHYSAEEVIRRAQDDFNFFCAMALPLVCTSPFPDFYVGVFWRIVDALQRAKDLSKFAIGIPRAHAKTTYAKLVIAWMILFTKKRYFLVIGLTERKAQDIITDIITILEQPNIVALFGRWDTDTSIDSKTERRFRFRGRNIVLSAAGPTGGAVRGTSKDFKRPDFILLDDIIDQPDSESPTVSEQRYLWLLGTLLPAGDPHNCQYLYLGNKYAGEGCILTKLQELEDWTSLVVGCILSDGLPLWKEVHTLYALQDRLRSYIKANKASVFFAEWMNDVGNSNKTGFDFDKVEFYTPAPELTPDAQWLIIDPAGGKEKSDNQALGHCQSWSGRPHIKHMEVYEGSAPGLVYHTIKYCLAAQIPIILVEAGGYQVTLIQWFNHIIAENKILGLNVVEIPVMQRSKTPRILAGLRSLQARELTLDPSVQSQVFAEISNFNPLVTNNVDDRLDVVAYAAESLVRYSEDILNAQHFYSDSGIINDPTQNGELIEESML